MIPNRIVVLGGSTVHGQGDPAGGGFVARLRAWHESARPETNRVFNLGVGGDAVAEMLARGPAEVSARRAELIILYPGLNDIRRVGSKLQPMQTALDVFRQDLQKLIGAIRPIAPLVIMSAIPPDELRTLPFRGKWFFCRNDSAEVAKIVSTIAEELKLPYLPIFEHWQNRPNLNDLLEDGLHCNGQGHQLLFEELRSLLQEHFDTRVAA